jgi:hypothetical protein
MLFDGETRESECRNDESEDRHNNRQSNGKRIAHTKKPCVRQHHDDNSDHHEQVGAVIHRGTRGDPSPPPPSVLHHLWQPFFAYPVAGPEVAPRAAATPNEEKRQSVSCNFYNYCRRIAARNMGGETCSRQVKEERITRKLCCLLREMIRFLTRKRFHACN